MGDDKNDVIDLLVNLGVARTDALTYAALLQIESVSIRKVAAHTGVNRGTTYDSLKRLISLGLVSVKHKGKREHYSAESPEKIYDIIRERRHELLDVSEAAKKVVPDLLARHVRTGGQPLVKYYEDDEGMVTILKDVLQTCLALHEPQYYVYSSGEVRHHLYRKFSKFTQRRIDSNIAVKVIALGGGGETAAMAERKWLPVSANDTSSSYTIIYGDKTALISIASNNSLYGVVIEDRGTASMQRLLFEKLWETL